MATQKRIYLVTDELGKTATMVRAVSQAQAVAHVVNGLYKASVAKPDQIAAFYEANPGTKIETAKPESEEVELE